MGNICAQGGSVDITTTENGRGGAAAQQGPSTSKARAKAETKKSEKTFSDPIKMDPKPQSPESKPDQPLNLPPLIDDTEQIQCVVGNFDDMKDGQMKEVSLGDSTVLLVRDKGAYHALSSKCTHYGAPLVKGALCNGRVRCPWHGACFNTESGDIEDFPGLDSLQSFEVTLKDDQVLVAAKKTALASAKRIKNMQSRDQEVSIVHLIIGGGAAALVCAETLRQEGFRGRIVVATKESATPYDRPKLSKLLTANASDIALRPEDFYSVYDIEFQLGMEAIKLDTSSNTATFQREGGTTDIEYDSVMIATGGSPQPCSSPGSDLQNVFLLRTPNDANKLAEASKGKKVVIIGSSFIAMEVAVYLVDKGKAGSVTVVGRSSIPFAKVFGETIGGYIMAMFTEKGVHFKMNSGVTEMIGDNGKLKEVVLIGGEKLSADVCLVGAGVAPATDFLKSSGVELTNRGNVVVDEYMRTNIENVYAAGDIVSFPLFLADNERAVIGHWQMAHAHGRTAALNMVDERTKIHSVPYFWTVLFGKSVRYTGYGEFDDIILVGDQSKFAAFYTQGQKLIAASSMNYDPVVSKVAEMFQNGKNISKSTIQSDPQAFIDGL